MYGFQLDNLARTIKEPTAPFPAMPRFVAGRDEETGEYFIADNGDEEFRGSRDEFIAFFAGIAIYDLQVFFDNDDAAVNAAIEEAL